MRIIKKTWSVLIEWLIVLTLINIITITIFSMIKDVNHSYSETMIQKQASFLISEQFEKLISSRNTWLNLDRTKGWDNFKKVIELNPTSNYKLSLCLDPTVCIVWQFILSKWNTLEFTTDNPPITYKTKINAVFLDWDHEKIKFTVTVLWDPLEGKGEWFINQLSQNLILTKNQWYENN